MRFCDLFISYKIGLKGIKSTIPFTKLPLYRKIAVIAIFSISILSAIFFMFKLNILALITLVIGIISLMIFLIIDSRKTNLELMLREHYSPYSKKRIDMVIDVLREYNIDIHNENTINLLIDEAQKAQVQSNYLLSLKKPLKTLAAIIVPIVVYVAEKIGDNASQDEMITIAVQVIIIILLISSLIFALTSIVKDILYRDYNKYSELIYDLRQIKLFFAKEDSASSN